MDPQAGMPVWAYGAIAGAVVLFLLIMILSMRRAFRKARTATADSFATIEQQTGLRVVARDGARSRMEGTYRGRQVAVDTDASGVTRAAYGATAMGVGASLALGAMGGSRASQQSQDRRIARRAKAMIDAAPIKLRWIVHLPAELPGRTEMVVEPPAADRAGFVQLSPDLWARSDQAAIVGSPDVVAALDPLPIDRLTAAGRQIELIWAPSMEEYQAELGDPAGFGRRVREVLDGMSTLADRLAQA